MLPITFTGTEDTSGREFLTALYLAHYLLMEHVALGILRDAGDAQEAVQSSVLRLVGRVGVLRSLSEAQVVCYLCKTVKSVALNFLRQKNRQGTGEPELDCFPDDHDGPEQTYIRMESYDELGRAIASLGERDRDLLYFKYYLELPNTEICAALGISESSIRPLLHRARKRALHALEGRGDR